MLLPDRIKAYSLSMALLTVCTLAAALTLKQVPLLKRVDLNSPLDVQISEASLTQWQSRRAFDAKQPHAIRFELALAALNQDPQNADLWLNYATAALGATKKDEAYRALMVALSLVPYDTRTISQRLYLISNLFHLMSQDDVRLAVNFVRWAWDARRRVVVRALGHSDNKFEHFLRLRLLQDDRDLFMEIMGHKTRR